MTQDVTMIVRLDVDQQGDVFYVTSPNLSGLNVCGIGAEATFQSVIKVIKALYRHNKGYDVEVWPATLDDKQFPKMVNLCHEMVVRLKAA